MAEWADFARWHRERRLSAKSRARAQSAAGSRKALAVFHSWAGNDGGRSPRLGRPPAAVETLCVSRRDIFASKDSRVATRRPVFTRADKRRAPRPQAEAHSFIPGANFLRWRLSLFVDRMDSRLPA